MTKKKKSEPKRKSTEDVFDDMTMEFIVTMEKVDCSKRDFLEGLRAAARSLRERANQYASEIAEDDE